MQGVFVGRRGWKFCGIFLMYWRRLELNETESFLGFLSWKV